MILYDFPLNSCSYMILLPNCNFFLVYKVTRDLHILRYFCVFCSPVIYWRVNSLQETIARQTIELTFEPFFHWTKNFKTSKISNISKFLKFSKNVKTSKYSKISNFKKIQNFHKISKFSKNFKHFSFHKISKFQYLNNNIEKHVIKI